MEQREDPNNDIRKYFKRKEKPIHKESRPQGILRRLRMEQQQLVAQRIPRMSAPVTTSFESHPDFQMRDYTIRKETDFVEVQ